MIILHSLTIQFYTVKERLSLLLVNQKFIRKFISVNHLLQRYKCTTTANLPAKENLKSEHMGQFRTNQWEIFHFYDYLKTSMKEKHGAWFLRFPGGTRRQPFLPIHPFCFNKTRFDFSFILGTKERNLIHFLKT